MEDAQRQAALVVRRVLEGAALPAALAAVAATESATRSAPRGRRRALVQELAYGTLRHWGRLDALAQALSAKPFSDPLLASLVAVALYQLDHTRAPAFAIVDHAVNAAGATVRPAAKRLVNALLRRYLRERDDLNRAAEASPVAHWSYPAWWIDAVRSDYPEDWEAILRAGNERPPLALRINGRSTTREAFISACAAAGVEAHPAGEAGVIVYPPRAVTDLPGYAEGWFAVQDLGAQLAAPLLQLEPGLRVLDACAAPGGKTGHLAETGGLELTALDSDAARLTRLHENLVRLRLNTEAVRIQTGDASKPVDWWDERPYARILADVPCSASGVVRRHPDGKWLRRPDDLQQFADLQTRILDALWPCLASDGLLLYATCSIFIAENETRVAAFLATHPDALRETISYPDAVMHRGGQLLPSLPGAAHNQDGFFYALLRKT